MMMLPDPQDHDDGWECPPVDPDEFAHHLAMWAECPASTPQKPTQRVTEWRWRLFIQTHGLQWDPESETYQAQENQQ